jgi:hypothetical protein
MEQILAVSLMRPHRFRSKRKPEKLLFLLLLTMETSKTKKNQNQDGGALNGWTRVVGRWREVYPSFFLHPPSTSHAIIILRILFTLSFVPPSLSPLLTLFLSPLSVDPSLLHVIEKKKIQGKKDFPLLHSSLAFSFFFF